MTDILDRITLKPLATSYSHFRPKSAAELFALCLARKLNDGLAAGHYSDLVAQHSVEHLLVAYRRTVAAGKVGDPARLFHDELKRLNGRNGHSCGTDRLITVRIERRAIAIAVARGTELEHAQVRQLSSNGDKAIASAAIFIERTLEQFPSESVAVETNPENREVQRSQMLRAVLDVLKGQGSAISYVGKREVFDAFGNPGLRSRKELRAVIGTIWPILGDYGGSPYIQDAVALALYVQTECLFNT